MVLLNKDFDSLEKIIEVLRKNLHIMIIDERRDFSSKEVLYLSQLLDEYLVQFAKK